MVLALLLSCTQPAVASSKPKAEPPQPPSNADCLACHNDQTLSKDVQGKPVSLYVSDKHFAGSIHGMLSCTDCHDDVKALPHESTPATPSCARCHAAEYTAQRASR